MKIYHYYHIYADGFWLDPLKEHINACKISGLLKNLEEIKIGIVGNKKNRNLVKKWLIKNKINFNVVAEENTGWHQVTLNELQKDSKKIDGYVFSAHTKGATSPGSNCSFPPGPNRILWRKTMCYYNVIKWKQCVEALKNNDVCGAFWTDTHDLFPTDPHKKYEWFFMGNYWWTSMEYIRELSELLNDNPWDAEGWISLCNKKILVKDFAINWKEEREKRINAYGALLTYKFYYNEDFV